LSDGVVLKRKIFVGGVNPALGNDVLKNYFSTFGPVEDATIMRYGKSTIFDDTLILKHFFFDYLADGRSRGFGFVVFLNEATCTQVLEQRTHPVTAHDKVWTFFLFVIIKKKNWSFNPFSILGRSKTLFITM
jgi:RNA recognition motif-containing protein